MDLILLSYIADWFFGDPQWFPHPVRLMGRLIAFLERGLNGSGNQKIERFYGVFTALVVIAVSGGGACALIAAAEKLHPLAGKVVWVFLAYSTLAVKDLVIHARAVGEMLAVNDIAEARRRLSLIVGRDTAGLSQDEVIRAAVETVAESTTDGIVSPLFYLLLGGPVAAVMFKAVSTLDSMIGHKDERHLYFGWCAAKLDDAANFIPARITGLLIAAAALCCRKGPGQSLRMMFRDGRKQDSPNSAIAEAAMAGALGVQLGGARAYAGRIVEHPYIGEQQRPFSLHLIREALCISVVTSVLMVSIGIITRQAVLRLIV